MRIVNSMIKIIQNILPKCFLLEAASIIFIAITIPFWFPVVAILFCVSLVLSLFGIGGILFFS